MAINYQWRKDGVVVSGATDAIYTTPSLNLSDDGSLYSCVVTNTVSNISVTSEKAVLTVNATGDPPVITNQPDSIAVDQDSTAVFGIAIESDLVVPAISNYLFRMSIRRPLGVGVGVP